MLADLEKSIGYTFKDKGLAGQALTHSSYANEHKENGVSDNERLEFLGDAVLETVSSEYLYNRFPGKTEGELSKMRASMVCEPTLAQCAADFNLGSFLKLGKGEEALGGRFRDSIVSDALEALIGAVYIDGGFDAAKEFVLRRILKHIEEKDLFVDSKTRLQEIVQEQKKKPVYELVKEEGPDHNKTFTVTVSVEGRVLGTGSGHTKKAAQQKAAYEAIDNLKTNRCNI